MCGRVRVRVRVRVRWSQVFWVSDNYLFHACAMQRIYQLTEKQLNRQVY